MSGRGVGKKAGRRIENPQEDGDESGSFLLDEKAIGVLEDELGLRELVGEDVDDVPNKRGESSRPDTVAGDIADENGDPAILEPEDIVEVTADHGFLGGRTVEMGKLRPGEYLREVE